LRHFGSSPARRRGAATLAVALFTALFSAHPRIARADPPVAVSPTPEDTALLERLHDAEAQAEVTAARPPPPEPIPEFMSPDGVDDPFPDRPPVIRPRQPAILLGLGLGVAVASTITARLTLLPDCTDERDAMTCTVPSEGDIGIRGGRLVATTAFSIGGAVFGVLGGRELGLLLQRGSGDTLERRRRIAVGIGTTSTVLGLVGVVAGATVLGLGASRSLAMAKTFDNTTDMTDPAVVARIDDTVTNVRTARVGLMILAASPAFLATGIALLVHRPKLPRVTMQPMLSRTTFGLGATVRF
jgi:hypothetical protein